jgi:uncharacterized membrane protein YfcA
MSSVILPYFLVMAAVLFGFTIQATVGVGGGLVVAPVSLALFPPVEAVLALSILGIALTARRLLSSTRISFEKRLLLPLYAGAIPAQLVGLALLVQLPQQTIRLLIAAVLLVVGIKQLTRSLRPAAVRKLSTGGQILSGTGVGFGSSIGAPMGPAMAARFLDSGISGAELRDTMLLMFLPLCLVSTGVLSIAAGGFEQGGAGVLVLVTLPMMLVAYLIGGALLKKGLSERHQRLLIVGLCFFGSLSLLISAL